MGMLEVGRCYLMESRSLSVSTGWLGWSVYTHSKLCTFNILEDES